MSVVDNSVFDEPFTSIELTNAINRRPHTPEGLGALFDWTVIAGATVVVALKDSIEAAAGQVGQLAGVSSAFETAAAGLIAVAAVVGIVAAGWAAWEWVQSRRTYEGVVS